jgi:hypothetical protein
METEMSFNNPGAIASARMARTRSRQAGNLDLADDDSNDPAREDHYAHAAGAICEKCDHMIEAAQIARRRGETGWVHDMCPVVVG